MADIPDGMQYPLMRNDYGRIVPIRDFFDLDDMVQQAFRNMEVHPQYSRLNRPSTDRPIMISTPEEMKQQFSPTDRQASIYNAQSDISLDAMESQMTYHGLETGILYPIFKRLRGDLDIANEFDIAKRTCIEMGIIEAGDPNINSKVRDAFRDSDALKNFNVSQKRKEYFGRELTDDEIQKCFAAGIAPQGINAIAKYVENGYDFNASFEMLDKMTWAKWSRDSRRFFSFDNLFSMGAEMLTDPTTYLPYGVALKFPSFMARYIGRGLITKAFQNAGIRGIQTAKHVGGGSFIAGGAGYTYAQVRNYQGIDEDVWGITGAAMAFGGALGFLGGLGKKSSTMAVETVDNIVRDIAGSSQEAKIMDAIHTDVKSSPWSGQQPVGAAMREEKAALGEVAKIKESMRAEEDKMLALEIKGKVTPDDVSNHYKQMEIYKNQIEVIDERVAKEQAAEREMGASVLEYAKNREEALENSSGRIRDELRQATDADFTKAQRAWRWFTKKIPNWTLAGVADFQTNPEYIAHFQKIKPNEQGWTMVNKDGKLVNVRSAGVNVIDTQRIIQERGGVPLNDFISKTNELADAQGVSPQLIYDKFCQFMRTHHTMNMQLSDNEAKALEPLLAMFKDFKGMATDQSKVIGVGERTVINPKGEQQLVPITPLMEKAPEGYYFPSRADSEKLTKIKQAEKEKVAGWDSHDKVISGEADDIATNNISKQIEDNLYTGTRENETLLKVFDTAQDNNEAYLLSKDKNYKSDIQKAYDSYDRAFKTINADEITIKKVNQEITDLKSKNKSVKGKLSQKSKLEKAIAKNKAIIDSLGVGNGKLGITAKEQMYRQVRDTQLRELSKSRAYGMVNQSYENNVGWNSKVGFGGIDYTEHKGNWWDDYFRSHESTANMSDILDNFIPRVSKEYVDQMSAKLSSNQVFGAKSWGELGQVQVDWENKVFRERKTTGKMSKEDQQIQQAARGMLMGVYGMSVKGGNHLGGSYINATAAEGILEALKLFTSGSKNGFFGFYNCNEASALIHAHGAMAFLKSLPILRNKISDRIVGVSPSTADMRLFRSMVVSDDLRYTRSWENIRRERSGKYGGDSIIGKIVSGADYFYRNSPLTRFQSHTQQTPEMMAVEYITGDLISFLHSNKAAVPKKGFGQGFFNQTDFSRMGIRADEFDRFSKGLLSSSYLENGAPRVNPDKLAEFLTPANRDVLHRMTSYVRDELIQGRSFMDNPLYASSELQPFWDIFLQFRSFSMQSFRKRILKSGNRIAYEGAGGEVAIQTMLNVGLGINMTLFKTIVKAQTMTGDEERERYLMAVLGVKSLSDIDLDDPSIYARVFKNGLLESSHFAGFSWAASLLSSQVAMRNTSTMDISIGKPDKDAPQIQKANYMLARNIPLIGKVNELFMSANSIIKYGMQPSKFRDVNNAYKDMSKILKTFLPNDPLSGAAFRGFYEIIKQPNK